MKTQPIGKSGLVSTRLNYGCMRIAGTWNPAEITPERRAAAHQAVFAALDAGYTHFDNADIYCRGGCEQLLGEALEQVGQREQVVITTKCGIRFGGDPRPDSPHRFDFTGEHILWSCDQSLQRLQTDYIDVYLLHRPDVLMNPPEIADAFDRLHRAGKVRSFGVSNFPPSQLAALQRHLPMPLVIHQIELHPGRLAPFVDGTLDQCLELGITPQAWSPVAGGLFCDGSTVPVDHPRHAVLAKLLAVLDGVARELGTSREVATYAWMMMHPSGVMPVIGTTKPERIREAVAADGVLMSREQWYRIYVAARGENLP